MSRRLVTLAVGAVVLVVFGALILRIPVPYVAEGPGPTFDTLSSVNGQRVITISRNDSASSDVVCSGVDSDQVAAAVDGGQRTDGQLRMVTVSVRDRPDLLTALRGWFEGGIAVVPREEVYPPGKSQEEIDEQNVAEFTQSQDFAEAAALKELGCPQRVVVARVDADSPSHGKLAGGDAITAVNGTPVSNIDELTGELDALKPGDEVTVDYLRDGASATATVTAAGDPGDGAKLGIVISDERVAPFDVSVSLADIGGPSAGMMFALGIIEKVGGGDLTGGRPIAGTGTIDPDGQVGQIGGISEKMIGAQRDGATAFLVPERNCADATRTAPDGLRLIRVETLHGALEALHQLRDGGDPPTC